MNQLIPRDAMRGFDRMELESHQLARLNALLQRVLPGNEYYRNHFQTDSLHLSSLAEWARMPTSRKSDWLGSNPSGLAVHHTFHESEYRRYHRTSGTRGSPMVILDTQDDWQWWIDTWQYVLDACRIESKDRIMMAFSFGPFIGFWSAHDACLQRGCMVIPCGGMSTIARIELIFAARPTVLFSTPSYAMHMAHEAESRGTPLKNCSIRSVFVAGEPGGSVGTVRQQIEMMYGAQVMDHAGATEVGPWGFGSRDGQSLHVIESEFIAEFLPPANSIDLGENVQNVSELVLTSLGRVGAPVLRYRTGDLVRPIPSSDPKCTFICLSGGVLGRADDMIVVRGVNIFPTSIDAIVRSFPSIIEYRLIVSKSGALDQLTLEIESNDMNSDRLVFRLSEKLVVQLNLKIQVVHVETGSLPRPEGKAKRIIDVRTS